MISESSISEEVWDWIALDDDDKELLSVYQGEVNQDGTIEEAQEAFDGRYDSETDWAAEYWESTGMLSQIPETLQNYIDYESFARDARLGGDMVFVRHEGEIWAFHNV